MPRRNLLAICAVALISLACYRTADRNPFGRYFAEVVDHIERQYVDEVDRDRLWSAAVEGMIGELHDPYSRFIAPEEAARLEEELEQQFGGVGIQVAMDPKSKKLTVISPIVGSPAYKAGILAGDVITKIDGQSTAEMTTSDASRLMRGHPGETVNLTIERAGQTEPIELHNIRREIIKVDSVLGDERLADDHWDFLLHGDSKIGYVRITSFGDRTVGELGAALEQMRAAGMRGLILDLRNNPGGLLDAAIGVCEMFLPSGTKIVSVQGRDNPINQRERVAYAGEGEKFLDLPLAIIVNGGSASASEIVAACLQDHGRAVVIGERSYGKGTVQNVINLNGKRGKLTLTTADYIRPSGKNIHRHPDDSESDVWGVLPDDEFAVEMKPDDWRKWIDWRSDRDVVRPKQAADKPVATSSADDKQAEQAGADDSDATKPERDAVTEANPWHADPPLERAIEYIQSKLDKDHARTDRA